MIVMLDTETRRALALDYLRTYTAKVPADLHLEFFQLDDRTTHYYRGDQLEEAANHVAGYSGQIYLNVSAAGEARDANRRISKADADYTLVLVADGDVKPGAFASKDDARTFFQSLAAKPSWVLDSGGGLQAFWRYAQVSRLTDDSRGEFAELAELWGRYVRAQASARAVHLDSTHDLARLMRVPGGLNTKPEYGEALPVLVDSMSDRQYTPDTLRRLVPAETARPPKAVVTSNGVVGNQLGDAELLARARSAGNGRFARLYDDGDISGYPSQSEADLALVSGLMFWTNNDGSRADRLFRDSALYRPKWEREDYRERTLSEAYRPGGGYSGRGEISRADMNKAGLLEASDIAEKPGCTDVGNAYRFARLCGGHVHYCDPWGQWLHWDRRRWQRDNTQRIWRLARTTVRGILKEAAKETDDGRRSQLSKWAIASESKSLLTNMIGLAESEPGIPITPEELDADAWLLNCRNGTVDLRTGVLRDHDRTDLITKLAPVVYDPGATCPAWDAFLARIMGGKAELIDYLQRVVGMSLVGEQVEHALFFLYGLGANGKSTFISALLAVLGDYGKQVAPDLLMYSEHDRHPTGLADLFGVRLAASTEVEAGRRFAEVLVKQMTGGDRQKARFMHKDFFEFDPTHTIFLAANHKPMIQGGDHAMWRRIRLIPFEVTIPAAEQNPTLPKKLRGELPGILAWAVRGCLDWQRAGLRDPDIVTAATDAYRDEMDALGSFLATCCEVKKAGQVTGGDLYKGYQSWAEKEGERAITQRTFALRLQERGFRRGKDNKSRRCWFGIGLIASSLDTLGTSSGNFSRERVIENFTEHPSNASGSGSVDASDEATY
jgi:putative DNA primase/helicase